VIEGRAARQWSPVRKRTGDRDRLVEILESLGALTEHDRTVKFCGFQIALDNIPPWEPGTGWV